MAYKINPQHRAKLREMGMCTSCGIRVAATGFRQCDRCRQAARFKIRRQAERTGKWAPSGIPHRLRAYGVAAQVLKAAREFVAALGSGKANQEHAQHLMDTVRLYEYERQEAKKELASRGVGA